MTDRPKDPVVVDWKSLKGMGADTLAGQAEDEVHKRVDRAVVLLGAEAKYLREKLLASLARGISGPVLNVARHAHSCLIIPRVLARVVVIDSATKDVDGVYRVEPLLLADACQFNPLRASAFRDARARKKSQKGRWRPRQDSNFRPLV
jgi:hypothetical protein